MHGIFVIFFSITIHSPTIAYAVPAVKNNGNSILLLADSLPLLIVASRLFPGLLVPIVLAVSGTIGKNLVFGYRDILCIGIKIFKD